MVFNMASWAKKEISKLVGTPRLLLTTQPPLPPCKPPQPPLQSQASESKVVKIVVAADLRCSKCRDRVAEAISGIDFNAMESLEVDVTTKEVTLQLHHSVPSLQEGRTQ